MTMLTQVQGTISVVDAAPELVDAFTDRLMDILLTRSEVVDPDVSAALAAGEVEVTFQLPVRTAAEGQTRGPAILHEVVQAAGIRPAKAWTDVPDHPNPGWLADLVETQPDMLRKVTTELVDA